MEIKKSLFQAAGIFRKRAGLFIAWIFTHLLISGFLAAVYFIGMVAIVTLVSSIVVEPFTVSHQPIPPAVRSFLLFMFSSPFLKQVSFAVIIPIILAVSIPFFAIVSSQFSIGCYKLAFSIIKNREAKFPEFFQFEKFWGNFTHSFLFSWLLFSAIGFGILGWIDGFYWSPFFYIVDFILLGAFSYYFLAYRFVKPILIEKKTGLFEAMQRSRFLVDKNLFSLIILFIYFPLFGLLVSIGDKFFQAFSPYYTAIPVGLFSFLVALSIVPLQCCSVAVAFEEAEQKSEASVVNKPQIPSEPWFK
jgi:hypothetical protein